MASVPVWYMVRCSVVTRDRCASVTRDKCASVARCTWILRILIQLVRWLSLQLVHEWRRVRCVRRGTWVRCVHCTVCTVGQMGTCVVVLLCGVHVPPCAVDTTVTLSRNLHCVNRCANVPAATCCYVLLLLLYPHHMRHMRHMPLHTKLFNCAILATCRHDAATSLVLGVTTVHVLSMCRCITALHGASTPANPAH